MNWTAWNSVVANALTDRPSAVPSRASTTATRTRNQVGPSTSRPSTPTVQAETSSAWTIAEQPEGEGVADEEVGLAHGHGEQPLQRSAGPLAQGRDARDEEHHDEREDPEQRRADLVEGVRPGVDPARAARSATTGTTSSSATVRGSRRSCWSTRSAVARGHCARSCRRRLDEGEERALDVGGARTSQAARPGCRRRGSRRRA